MRIRKKTRQVFVRDVAIGGDSPVSIQSMTNLPIEEVEKTIDQINRLESIGAQIVRLALRDEDSIEYLKKIIKSVNIPLCADIHFNYKIALAAIKAGIDKVRINPGNIGDQSRVREVVKAAKDYGVPIRIGVNGGSIDRKKYSKVTPKNLVESAMEHVLILEENNFSDIIVSIKSSDIYDTIEANKLFSKTRDYPIHVGLTEAGYGTASIVQSSVVIGHLLLLGIGDTIRVSITGDPIDEIVVGKKILESVGEKQSLIKIISCPTCGRTDPELNILDLAQRIENDLTEKCSEKLKEMGETITVAVMGCEVNGPGEASDADIGLAGGRNGAILLFAKGEKIRKIDQEKAVQVLVEEVIKMIDK